MWLCISDEKDFKKQSRVAALAIKNSTENFHM